MTEETARTRLVEWATAHGLTMTAERITRETFALAIPPDKDEKPQRDRTYWTLTLRNASGATFSVPFSNGSQAWWKVRGSFDHRRDGEGFGARCRSCFTEWPCDEAIKRSWNTTATSYHPAAPDVADLLDCMASDASGYDNARDFADWASEYGYDEDSRTVERTYNLIAEQAKQLRRVLGSETYEELLWRTERL